MPVEEHEAGVPCRLEYNRYFKTNVKLFPAMEFLVQLLQHRSEPRAHLVRLAPQGWIQQHEQRCALYVSEVHENTPAQSVSARQSRAAWARLRAKIHEVDVTGGSGAQPRGSPLKCSRCGSPVKVLAVITDPPQVRRVLLHLIKTGAAPPGLDASELN